jgi:hypothetical protein
MPESKSGSSGKLYLVAGLLLLVSAGVVAAMVPLMECPACDGKGTITVGLSSTSQGRIGSAKADCPNCDRTGKVTLFKKLQIPSIDKSILPGGELSK